jgi:hypothetical protein
MSEMKDRLQRKAYRMGVALFFIGFFIALIKGWLS